MISEKTPYKPRKSLNENFDDLIGVGELKSNSHRRVETLDLKFIYELREMKYDVGPEGIMIWDKQSGYNSKIKSRRILDQWINIKDFKKVILYNIVLPQEIYIEEDTYKLIFLVESHCIYKRDEVVMMETNDIRRKFSYNNDIDNLTPDITLCEGIFLVCY